MSKNITQDMAYRQSLMKDTQKNGVSKASRKYNKSRPYIYFWLERWSRNPDLGIRHKLICPYTPHHNGKVERSVRTLPLESQKHDGFDTIGIKPIVLFSCINTYGTRLFVLDLSLDLRSLSS